MLCVYIEDAGKKGTSVQSEVPFLPASLFTYNFHYFFIVFKDPKGEASSGDLLVYHNKNDSNFSGS